jgi:hypothetical protein
MNVRKIITTTAALLCAIAVSAQNSGHSGHEGHSGHSDHSGHSHNPADETPSALLRDMDNAIASQPGDHVFVQSSAIVPRFALAVQKNMFAEIGASLDLYRMGYTAASEYVSFGYSNLRPYVAGEIMLGKPLIGGAKAGIEYIRSTPILGMAFGADATFYSDGHDNATVITPRLMLSFVKFELYYGYNIFVHNELTQWIGHHRFGVSMTLHPRFWRHKKRFYEEYYNSYQTP